MRKILCVLCLLLVCCGCSNKEKKDSEAYVIDAFPSVSEQGVYHIVKGKIGNQLYFYDGETNQDVPLCAKPNCDHNNNQCEAYLITQYKDTVMNYPPMPYEGKLYGVYMNMQTGNNYLCSMEEDGSDRKEILKLTDGAIASLMIYKNKAYICLETFEHDENGKIGRLAENYLTYIGDLTNGKLTQLDLDEDSIVNFEGVWDKQVMYMTIKEENDNVKGVLMSLSEDGKENKVFLDNMSTLNAFLYKGSIYSNDNQQIKKLDLKTKEEADVCQVHTDGCTLDSGVNDPFGLMRITCVKDNRFVKEIYVDLEKKQQVSIEGNIYTKYKDGYLVMDEQGLLKFVNE